MIARLAVARCRRVVAGTAASSGTLRSDSRAVNPGDGFVAWPGAATDGRRHTSPPRWPPVQRRAWSRTTASTAIALRRPPASQSLAGLKAAAGHHRRHLCFEHPSPPAAR